MEPAFTTKRRLELAICQINAVVGDLVGNADLVIENAHSASESGAQIALFPELALSGYPPEDLVLREDFLVATGRQLERVAAATDGIVVAVGFPMAHPAGVANALAVLAGGEVVATYRKQLLPNYGVFDERRYFVPGDSDGIVLVDGIPVGLTICEDVWFDGPVVSGLEAAGARLILNASASPFHTGKSHEREAMLSARANKFSMPIAYCNLVGGQDELVFDGASVVIDGNGEVTARGPQFDTALLRCAVDVEEPPTRLREELTRIELPAGTAAEVAPLAAPLIPREHETYRALMLGIHDYVDKNGFPGVLVGVSGGIDSAVVLALACDALGPERVTAVTMPSPYNSPETQADGRELIERLGCASHEFAIKPAMDAFTAMLEQPFSSSDPDQTEENVQARIRGILLMALSNKFGALVLTTGNKSEMAVGYATLYGDMAGGFAALKDVPKQLVFALARWRNTAAPYSGAADNPVPRGIIDRPPSAELRPDQTDEATLGSYEALDDIIERYIEQDQGIDEMVAAGADREFATKIIRMIDLAEYKRRQAPPGVKITQRAFGRDRRMPITARRRFR
ncbi:MAG: NAD+ synthase [Solirubrobacterales bacterium]